MANITLDMMEYSSDASAQAAYPTNAVNTGSDDADTTLLIHFDGTNGQTTYTAETGQTVTFVSGAQLSTTSPKFGTASLLLNGSSDYVTVPDSNDWNFGTGDFTIEGWFKANASLNGAYTITSQRADSDNYITFFGNTDGTPFLQFIAYSGGIRVAYYYATITGTTFTNQNHIAFVRYGAHGYFYVNGVGFSATEGTAFGTMPDIAAALAIGYDPVRGYWWGNIDELRITKGVARYTANFTPQTFNFMPLQDFSSSTIKSQGSYSLGAIAGRTTSNTKTLTRSIGSPIDLSNGTAIRFDIYASRTGGNIKVGIHDTGGTTTEKTYSVISANTWETAVWDISAVSNADKDAIDKIIITIVDASSANTFYIDNMYATIPAGAFLLLLME